jgi:hypothetical protein
MRRGGRQGHAELLSELIELSMRADEVSHRESQQFKASKGC